MARMFLIFHCMLLRPYEARGLANGSPHFLCVCVCTCDCVWMCMRVAVTMFVSVCVRVTLCVCVVGAHLKRDSLSLLLQACEVTGFRNSQFVKLPSHICQHFSVCVFLLSTAQQWETSEYSASLNKLNKGECCMSNSS